MTETAVCVYTPADGKALEVTLELRPVFWVYVLRIARETMPSEVIRIIQIVKTLVADNFVHLIMRQVPPVRQADEAGVGQIADVAEFLALHEVLNEGQVVVLRGAVLFAFDLDDVFGRRQ